MALPADYHLTNSFLHQLLKTHVLAPIIPKNNLFPAKEAACQKVEFFNFLAG